MFKFNKILRSLAQPLVQSATQRVAVAPASVQLPSVASQLARSPIPAPRVVPINPSFASILPSATPPPPVANTACRKPRNSQFWETKLKAHVFHHRRREETEKATKQIRTRGEVSLNRTSAAACEGDVRFEKLQYWLNHMPMKRSPDQVKFHKAFTNACLPHIYGKKDWSQNSVRVMEANGLKTIRYEVTAITPRRWGKTWSVASYVLSLMLSVPGIRVCVFSTGKRASSSLMEIIKQFMNQIPGLNERILKDNQEVSGTCADEIST